MKTNKKCPMYKNNPVNVAPTDQELAEHESNLSQDDLVKVEGTKVGQGNQGGSREPRWVESHIFRNRWRLCQATYSMHGIHMYTE